MSKEDKQKSSETSNDKHTRAIHGILRKSNPGRIAGDIRKLHVLVHRFKHRLSDMELRLLQEEEATSGTVKPSLNSIATWMESFGWNRHRRSNLEPMWLDLP